MIQHWSNVGESESLINSTILKEIETRGLNVEDIANDGEFHATFYDLNCQFKSDKLLMNH